MMTFSPDLVDPSRLSRALEAAMTPISVEDGTGTFASADGVLYYANLEDCSCPDFRFNQKMQKPCKHIIRMAMLAGEYSSAGMKEDPLAAYAQYYAGILEHFLREAPLPECINVIRILIMLQKPGLRITEDEALSFAGIPKLSESGLAEINEKKQKIILFSTKKKVIKSLGKTLSARLSEFILDNLDNPAVLDFIELTANYDNDND